VHDRYPAIISFSEFSEGLLTAVRERTREVCRLLLAVAVTRCATRPAESWRLLRAGAARKGQKHWDRTAELRASGCQAGPAAQAAFDGALALATWRKIRDAAFAAAGRVLPKSPYAADALSFIKKFA
jgi:hypothetical protein